MTERCKVFLSCLSSCMSEDTYCTIEGGGFLVSSFENAVFAFFSKKRKENAQANIFRFSLIQIKSLARLKSQSTSTFMLNIGLLPGWQEVQCKHGDERGADLFPTHPVQSPWKKARPCCFLFGFFWDHRPAKRKVHRRIDGWRGWTDHRERIQHLFAVSSRFSFLSLQASLFPALCKARPCKLGVKLHRWGVPIGVPLWWMYYSVELGTREP